MWGDGAEPQSSPALPSTDSIWSCSVKFIKTTSTLKSHPTENWGSNQGACRETKGGTRTAVNLPTVLPNQVVPVRPGIPGLVCIGISQDKKLDSQNFSVSKDHNWKRLGVKFPVQKKKKKKKGDNLTSAAPDLRITSDRLWLRMDRTNCWRVPCPISCEDLKRRDRLHSGASGGFNVVKIKALKRTNDQASLSGLSEGGEKKKIEKEKAKAGGLWGW